MEFSIDSSPWQTHLEAEAREQQLQQTLTYLNNKLSLLKDDTHTLRQRISDGNALIVKHSDARDVAQGRCSKLHYDALVCLFLSYKQHMILENRLYARFLSPCMPVLGEKWEHEPHENQTVA
jgi:hypothetical protein